MGEHNKNVLTERVRKLETKAEATTKDVEIIKDRLNKVEKKLHDAETALKEALKQAMSGVLPPKPKEKP